MSKDFYKILGVSKNASEDDIKKAYKKLAIQYHPDKLSGKSDKEKAEGEAKFKEINEAYQVLSDADKRRKFDQYGDPDAPEMGGGFGGFGDMFRDFFHGGGGWDNEPQHPQGQSIQMRVPLTIEEVMNGCVKKIHFKRKTRCNCGAIQFCSHCGGTGRIRKTERHGNSIFTQETYCPHCNGNGYITKKTNCSKCHSTGFEEKDVELEIRFNSGVMEGNAYPFRGKGHESMDAKGQNGDFIAIATYGFDTNKFIIQNGRDVFQKIEIPYYDALLGGDFDVKLGNNQTHKIHLNECTKNGFMVTLPNKGINGGNYIIIITYSTPSKLSNIERDNLKNIKQSK